mgnify:CR=1
MSKSPGAEQPGLFFCAQNMALDAKRPTDLIARDEIHSTLTMQVAARGNPSPPNRRQQGSSKEMAYFAS